MAVWIASIAVSTPAIFIESAKAGPAISFVYASVPFTQEQCMSRGISVLKKEGLLRPDNTLNLNETAFVNGENDDVTAIVDCSAVKISKRVTVMVTHATDLGIAFERAKIILNKISSR
ncbi:hypothetical protein [Chamaesiphon sp. OTE_75_metabat_556]|uniref:hypothetical protein n=1 Tax=Chamaesiphon sp. OTE_75_metabat_556 TaxID=2964692 RepID=UPI00286CA136|nr:hypothetical protein [Chamaesiphon sp. OTE_75_metabat_556]